MTYWSELDDEPDLFHEREIALIEPDVNVEKG